MNSRCQPIADVRDHWARCRWKRGWKPIAGVVAAALFVAVTPATADSPPPPGSQGPALTAASQDELDAAIHCDWADTTGAHEPVLLVNGTALTREEYWYWNYKPGLLQRGFDVCTLDQLRSLRDAQVTTEYVVNAIRRVNQWTGRKVGVIGHSQGTLHPRAAVKYWPDIQKRVDDVVLMSGPAHGTSQANVILTAIGGFPASWQFRVGSKYIRALNNPDETPGDTPPGNVSWTVIYSKTDELVQPGVFNPTAPIAGGTNIAIQDICPLDTTTHVSMLINPVAFDAVLDALTHPGPALVSRFVKPNECLQGPGFAGSNPAALPVIVAAEVLSQDLELPPFQWCIDPLWALTGMGDSACEPPLKPYAVPYLP